ncbi:SCO family protein [Cesiribacter sp. SM1]|uniref:SCO family protein n=1 Tax=Cesiribacter sp. SM1 TaxID=2861196 RepID=UPI001CD2B52F|nr:SCO family protein [Cesiribacter sp. SM1]
MNKSVLLMLLVLGAFACSEQKQPKDELPVYGETITTETDTTYHTIGNFAFYNQDSVLITDETVAGKVYVADFIFTTCPSICIPMAKEMLRVYDKYGNNSDFMILSHSIDPDYDTVPVLKEYASRLGVADSSNWHFLTGGETDVFTLGEKRYFVTAQKNEKAPGGVLHSGAFILIDGRGRIRGVYDGTDPAEVDKLMLDIDKLLN